MKKRIYFGCLLIAASLFALCVMFTPVLAPGSEQSCNPILFLTAFLCFLLIPNVLTSFTSKFSHNSKTPLCFCSDQILFGILFVLFFSIGIWNLLVYYPGTGGMDALAILTSPVSSVGAQHPWFYCLIVNILLRAAFKLGGDYETALVVCSLLQIITMALVFSGILLWLRRKQIPALVWFIIASMYLLYPLFHIYSVTLLKDVPFSLMLTVWIPVLYDYWKTDGVCLKNKKWIMSCVFLIFLSLLRNNGIYVTAFTLFVMLITNPKHWRRIGSLFLVLMMVMVGSSTVERIIGIQVLFKESVGIPLQQIAAVVANDGTINEDQLAFVDKIMPLDSIRKQYNPYSVDALKWEDVRVNDWFLHTHKVRFLKLWLRLFPDNPDIYLKAYLQNTYGFWALNTSDQNGVYTSISDSYWAPWLEENQIAVKSILPRNIQLGAESVLNWFRPFPTAGVYLWIFVTLMLVLMKRRDCRILVTAAPAIGCWLTVMISAPVAFQLRYVLSFPLAIPIIFGLLFCAEKRDTTEFLG